MVKVIDSARRATEGVPLSPEELGELSRRLVEAQDPAAADQIQQEIMRGFYGDGSHA